MKSLLTIVLVAIVSFYSYGRDVKGGIISNGKNRDVTFDIKPGNFERMQYGVKYYDEEGKKQNLSPEDAEEIWFDYDGEKVRMISCAVSGALMRGKQLFIHLEVDGYLKLFRIYDSKTNTKFRNGQAERTSRSASYFIYQKGSYTIDDPTVIFRKVDMLDYFSDCPALREQIEKSRLSDKDIKGFVKYYNENCANK